MPTLINETIPESHHQLLELALTNVGEELAYVSRFERFGFSGAYLYKLTPPEAISFVVKVDTAARIDREYAAAWNVRHQFDELQVDVAVGPINGQKALTYRLVTAPIGDVVELKQKYALALSANGAGRDALLKDVVKAINGTYKKFKTAHRFTKNDTKAKFRDQYGDYVRLRGGEFADRLTHLFESHVDPLVAYGIQFTNPRKAVESFLDTPVRPLRVSATHGDLHPSNVVFSSTDDPRLIDFAKAGRDQHLFKDFVTMESSLRFMMFPRHIHPALIGPVDEALNDHWSCEPAQRIVDAAVPSDGAWALGAMIACVQEVREACDRVLDQGAPALTGDEKKQEYFRALSLLLLGQQQFDTFPLIRVAVNLHLLGARYA
jgi:hypothetical protein